MTRLTDRLRGEIHGSEEHAAQLEHELTASRAHARELEARLRAIEHAAQHVDHSKPIPRHGIDYAWHGPINPSLLRKAGVSFAVRYLGPSPGQGKALSTGEARELASAGIDVVAVYETTGITAGGHAEGVRDAEQARSWAKGILPADRPVYFANDREPTGGLGPYLAGAASVLGHHGTGVYGGFAAVELAVTLHLCAYFWQTYAWSGSPTRWHPAAQLRQYRNDVRVAGISCDLDEARAADFGQWRG